MYLAVLNFSILVLYGANTTYLLAGMVDDTKRVLKSKQRPVIYTSLHFRTIEYMNIEMPVDSVRDLQNLLKK